MPLCILFFGATLGIDFLKVFFLFLFFPSLSSFSAGIWSDKDYLLYSVFLSFPSFPYSWSSWVGVTVLFVPCINRIFLVDIRFHNQIPMHSK